MTALYGHRSLLIEESSGLSIVKQGRISQTALEVAVLLVTLSVKDDWGRRLPPGLVDVVERLLMASGALGYGPRMMRLCKQPWMIRVYQIQDLMMPGQFEGFGHRKIFIQRMQPPARHREADLCSRTRSLVNARCSRSCSTSPENRGSPPFEART